MLIEKENKQLSGYADFSGFCTDLQEHVLAGWRISKEYPNSWANHIQYHVQLERDIPVEEQIEQAAEEAKEAISGLEEMLAKSKENDDTTTQAVAELKKRKKQF